MTETDLVQNEKSRVFFMKPSGWKEGTEILVFGELRGSFC